MGANIRTDGVRGLRYALGMPCRRLLMLAVTVILLAPVADSSAAEGPMRWTASSPDELVDLSLQAAQGNQADALARAVLIYSLDERATAGKARAALTTLARRGGTIAQDARWLSLILEPADPVPWRGLVGLGLDDTLGRHNRDGLLRTFAVLGPFEDTGGGLKRREGPESSSHSFVNADYSWGVYAVRSQRTVVDTVTPRGVPLDLYVHPRRESCSYLSSVVTLPSARPLVVQVAASGSFRLRWDGADVATEESDHPRMLLDRAAVALQGTPGDHLLTVKTCSGARADQGRLRIRLSDRRGRPMVLATSSRLERLQAVLDHLGTTGAIKSSATRVPTALERALAIGPAPTADQALAAAVLRQLAGADDLRSAKAPGLLDRVVDGADVTADHRAMAGYVAPAGANRSGWLAQSLQQARQQGDRRTEAFAQRALVELRLGAGLVDLARTTAEQAPLNKADDAHGRLLRAQALGQLGGTGLRALALERLVTIARSGGAKTPISVWRAIAKLSLYDHPSRGLGALQRVADQAAEARGPQYVEGFRMMGSSSFEQMALRLLLRQTSTKALDRIGHQLVAAGRYEAAHSTFELATLLSPNRPESFKGLAKTQVLLHPGQDRVEATIKPLQRAAELRPQDAQLSAEIAFRKGEQDVQPKAGEDGAYLIDAAEFLARAKARPMPKDGIFERHLHWRRVVRFHPDKRVSQITHYAREIGIEPRTEFERYEHIPGAFNSELLIARVHRKDGSVEPPEEQDASGPMVRWPKLKRGDIVEIAVRSWTPGPVGRRGDRPFYFVDYVGAVDTHPVLHNEVVIDTPDDGPLTFDVIGGKADERREETRDGRRITWLIWKAPPSIPDEPLAPRTSELLPVVVGSVYPSWDAFLGWYQGAVEGFTEPDDQTKRLAKELTAGKVTRDDKVEALFNFVADDIRYVNYVSGEWWLPNRPQQLLARRQGDCDDKAMLLISLLRSVGIEAREVLIQTRMTRRRAIMRSPRAAIPMFDHGIIYLPDEDGEGGRFLDATSPQSRMGSLPSMDSGAMALRMGDGEHSRIIETPQAKAADHGVEARWTLKLDPEGGGSLSASERHLGDRAFRLRTYLKQEDARAQWVEQNLVAGWFPSLEMETGVTFNGALDGGAAQVGYQARSGSLARREGTDLVVVVAPPMPITATLAPLTKRQLPVELPPSIAPMHRHMTIEIVAPRSHRFADLPPDGAEDGGPFGKASVTFALSPTKRKVTITRSLAFEQSRIAVSDYLGWRRWLQGIDRLMLRSVRLVPLAGGR
jgi:transglutaminase-like putative cysteine protease/tetratricopeptide (TPR) repeat protein